jgi:hypothetical protein
MYYILVSSNCPCFHIVAEHIVHILNKNNISAEMRFDKINNEISREDNLFVFWNNIVLDNSQTFDNIFIYNLDTTFIEGVRTEITKFINASNGLCRRLCVLNFSSNVSDITFFEKMNVECKILHYGYSEFHEKIYESSASTADKKDIDVLFYGAFTSPRIKKIKELSNFCKDKNYTFVFKDNVYNEREKSQLIKRSKIVVAFPSSHYVTEAGTNDLCRLSFLISNKVFIVAEKIGGDVEDDLLSYGIKLVSYDLFLENLEYYLKNSEEREKIMDHVYEKFKLNYDFERALKSCLL